MGLHLGSAALRTQRWSAAFFAAVKKALIVGSAGQDGRLLHELLSNKGYSIMGVARGGVPDILDRGAVFDVVSQLKPDEIYYLAAHHRSSEESAGDDLKLFQKSHEVNVQGLVHFLGAVKRHSPATRIFYAASSHVFGTPPAPVQDENTPIKPECIYGMTKAAGLFACRYYRETHGLFASVGICYNHESSLRDAKFLSRKIVQGALEIKAGKRESLVLGNLSAQADWGYAPDYVRAMHLILSHVQPDDFVLATGHGHSVRDFVDGVFSRLSLDWRSFVKEDPKILTKKNRILVGNPARLMSATGWKPSVDFEEMIELLLKEAESDPST
jgi:GDPmannose 4,6-dehydratase